MAALFSEIAQSQSCSGKQLEILPDSSEMENVKPSILAAVVKTLVGFSSPLHCLTASQLDCVFNNVSNTPQSDTRNMMHHKQNTKSSAKLMA